MLLTNIIPTQKVHDRVKTELAASQDTCSSLAGRQKAGRQEAAELQDELQATQVLASLMTGCSIFAVARLHTSRLMARHGAAWGDGTYSEMLSHGS